jgi:hypothetical protein
MKALLLIIAAVATAALSWPRQGVFQARWPEAMPPAMSWNMINKARKAAERPTGMTYTYCKYPDCKRG